MSQQLPLLNLTPQGICCFPMTYSWTSSRRHGGGGSAGSVLVRLPRRRTHALHGGAWAAVAHDPDHGLGGQTFGGLTPPSHQARLNYAREVGVRLPVLTFSGENWLPPGAAVDSSTRQISLAALATDHHHKEQVAEHVRGQIIADPDASFVKRFLAAFWRLCDQPIAVVTRPDDPAIGGTVNQPAEQPDVRVTPSET